MKKTLSLLFVLLLVSSLAVPASAKVVSTVGDWVVEKINDDTEFEIDNCTSTAENITVITDVGGIPVTSIGSHAFANNTTVKTLTATAPLKKICEYAFLNATSLCSVTLPSTLSVIETAAFSGASSLTSVNLEDTSLVTVSAYAFMNTGLTSVTLPSTCTTVENNAFLNCSSLKSVTIPSGVTAIGGEAFSGCENLVIYCEKGSYALTYAKENGVDYVVTDAESYLLGDANGDGVVTVLDATRIQRLLAKLTDDPTGIIAVRGDANQNGILEVVDATIIQRYLAKIEVPYSVGETFYY